MAQDLSGWLGTYAPLSRACKNDPIVISSTTLSYGKCKHSIVETLVNNKNELSVKVNTSSGCGWPNTIITLRRHPNGAVDFLDFETVEDLNNNSYQAYCAYGPQS